MVCVCVWQRETGREHLAVSCHYRSCCCVVVAVLQTDTGGGAVEGQNATFLERQTMHFVMKNAIKNAQLDDERNERLEGRLGTAHTHTHYVTHTQYYTHTHTHR